MFTTSIFETNQNKREIKRGPPNTRHLEILRHVSKGWLPSPLLPKVRTLLKEDSELATPRIIHTIKQDPALTLWCARSMKRVRPETRISPIENLASLEHPELVELFNAPDSEIAPRSSMRFTKNTVRRLEHAVVTAHAAASFASHTGVSPHEAFSVGSLKELGISLVAVNYPSIYSESVSRSKKEGDLDQTITKMLGISPQDLIHELSSTWGVAQQIRDTIIETGTLRSPLAQIVHDAQRYSQSQDGTTYPQKQSSHERTKLELERTYSASILTSLEQTSNDIHTLYDDLFTQPAQEVIRPLESPSLPADLHNVTLKRCTAEEQQLIVEAYASVTPGALSLKALEVLLGKVLPELECHDGCLFIASDTTGKLAPLLRIGPASRAQFGEMLHDMPSMILATPYSWVPLRSDGKGIRGDAVYAYSSGVELGKRAGVFYLESSHTSTHELTAILFATLREALRHSLGIR
jgi:hypothetical protein